MLITKPYNRDRAVMYARKWALSRNPLFADYTGFGGNCTNFVSQSLFAGGCVMNFTPVFGWYYIDQRYRTASWTGVDFFYNFITQNMGEGPFAKEVIAEEIMPGDVVQLGREGEGFYHTLLAVGRDVDSTILVAAQSDNVLDRRLSTYRYDFVRFLHVEGVRMEVRDFADCFPALYEGTSLVVNGEGKDAPAPLDGAE